MKHQSRKFWIIIFTLISLTSCANEFNCDGIYYRFNSDKTEVSVIAPIDSIKDFPYSGIVTVPKEVCHSGKMYPVTKIGPFAFKGSNELNAITIPTSITEISLGAFSGCSSLTEVVIPISVQKIETFAFQECNGLTEIVIPDSVMEIGLGAFNGCNGLRSITIGASVESIGAMAFTNCEALDRIIIKATEPPITEVEPFDFATYSNAVLYVPEKSVGQYKSTTMWENFVNIIGQ